MHVICCIIAKDCQCFRIKLSLTVTFDFEIQIISAIHDVYVSMTMSLKHKLLFLTTLAFAVANEAGKSSSNSGSSSSGSSSSGSSSSSSDESSDDVDEFSETYDYVIVGAGASGGMVAGELAKQLPNKDILLIEEGYFSVANPNIDDVTKHFDLLEDVTIEKFYFSTPQESVSNSEFHLTRSRVTGGCNAHNAQIWILANENDFSDQWGDINGWSLDDIVPIFDEIEETGYHNGQLDANDVLIDRCIDAAMEIGYPFNENYNDLKDGKSQEGVSPLIFQSENIFDAGTNTYFMQRHTYVTIVII